MFVTFEGIDGSGKSSVIDLVRQHFAGNERLGRLLISTSDFEVYPDQKALMLRSTNPLAQYHMIVGARLGTAHRIQDTSAPYSVLVLYDRYIDSTLAYQGAMGIPRERIIQDHLDCDLPVPDMTIVLDLPVSAARMRRGAARDRIEGLPAAFHEQVRESLLHDHQRLGLQRACLTVIASQPLEQVAAECIVHIESMLVSRAVADDEAWARKQRFSS